MGLTLLEDLGIQSITSTSKYTARFGKYKCECGAVCTLNTYRVTGGETTSCGCLSKRTEHGESKTRLYNVLTNMKARTTNPKHPKFKYYGALGIVVCDEWQDFLAFKAWALANGYEDTLSIDRRDNTLGYTPDNCRWTTQDVQTQNTRRLKSNNTSGFRGVMKTGNRFTVSIQVNKVRVALGTFTTAEEGAKARDAYIIKNALEHTLNFPA